MEQENKIRKLLQSEITWIIFIVGAIYAVVATIIIPISTMQIRLAQIQENQIETKADYKTAMTEHSLLSSRVDILETKLSQIIK